jgi:hypothetical protein
MRPAESSASPRATGMNSLNPVNGSVLSAAPRRPGELAAGIEAGAAVGAPDRVDGMLVPDSLARGERAVRTVAGGFNSPWIWSLPGVLLRPAEQRLQAQVQRVRPRVQPTRPGRTAGSHCSPPLNPPPLKDAQAASPAVAAAKRHLVTRWRTGISPPRRVHLGAPAPHAVQAQARSLDRRRSPP